jgi:hypothetical protein
LVCVRLAEVDQPDLDDHRVAVQEGDPGPIAALATPVAVARSEICLYLHVVLSSPDDPAFLQHYAARASMRIG